jgi:uncharacterized protein (DUF1015 family)
MHIKTFKAVFPKVDLITSPNSFFDSIKYQYREYRKSGVYRKSDEEGYYIYQIKSEYGIHTGLLCSTAVSDLKDHKMLKHEKTLAAKEQQIMHLIMQRKALVKPVLLGYYPEDNLHEEFVALTKKEMPEVDLKLEDGERHRLWSIYDQAMVDKIGKAFSKLEKAYIGDGHHRTTTVALLNESEELGEEAEKYNYILTAYFPFDQLQIWDYNRVVDITEIMPNSQFIAELSTFFNINKLKKARKPNKKHEITFFIDNVWYALNWKEKYITRKKKILLDTALINKYIFKGILGIVDIRSDSRIKYYGGVEPLSRIVKQCEKLVHGVGLCIYPVSVEELTQLADKGKTLPPKSTWFTPRLKSGIIAKDL